MFLRSVCSELISRAGSVLLSAAIYFALLFIVQLCPAQTIASNNTIQGPLITDTPNPNENPATPAVNKKGPLTDKEREELYELIKNLQERVAKLEAAQAKNEPVTKNSSNTSASASVPVANKPTSNVPDNPDEREAKSSSKKPENDDDKKWGIYTPNLGYKVADTPYGDMSISIYTNARYLNQLGLNETYIDALGNEKNVQNRQDIQLTKLQIKFLGWVLNPKLRYFLYAWTSNANQGQGAQVVLAGNLSYTVNKHLTFAGGIRSLPGTRSVEGNFPFWLSVDSRHIADEYFRPSYTNGVWASGAIVKNLKYIVMLGNNLSTLGVPASRIDNGLNTFSGSLVWLPTGNFEDGFSGQGWGDFENHQKFSTRLGFHFTRSDENKESQPNSENFENTQLRISDGTVIFTPNLFGPGKTVTDARYRMSTVDGGFKYKGYSVEGEYYWRWLDNFRGTNTAGIPSLFDHGYQLQGSFMPIKKTLQVYTGTSKIFGQYGNPWDFRAGTNWFPYHNHVLRWNNEALYLRKSPVGYTSVPFALGGTGWVFLSTVELAF